MVARTQLNVTLHGHWMSCLTLCNTLEPILIFKIPIGVVRFWQYLYKFVVLVFSTTPPPPAPRTRNDFDIAVLCREKRKDCAFPTPRKLLDQLNIFLNLFACKSSLPAWSNGVSISRHLLNITRTLVRCEQIMKMATTQLGLLFRIALTLRGWAYLKKIINRKYSHKEERLK